MHRRNLKPIVAIIALIHALNSNAQVSPDEVAGFLVEINYNIEQFDRLQWSIHSNSVEYISRDDVSQEEINDSKISDIEELKSVRQDVLNIIIEFKGLTYPLVEDIQKDAPFIPSFAKELADSYDSAYQYMDMIYLDFDSTSANFIQAMEEDYGKNDLKEIFVDEEMHTSVWDKVTGYGSITDMGIWYLRDRLKSDDYLVKYNNYGDVNRYDNEIKFRKKLKADTLIGYYSDESRNTFIVRNIKSKFYGLVDIDYQFNLKSAEVVFKMQYDSIKFDQAYGDYGNSIWTTAVAWKNEEATVKEKKFEYPGEPDDNFEFITYPCPVNNVWFPSMNTETYGLAATLDADGNYYYLDLDKNEIWSLSYPKEEQLPLIIRGQKNTDCRVKLKDGRTKYGSVWGYENDDYEYMLCYLDTTGHLSWYVDTMAYWTFYDSGEVENKIFFKEHYKSGLFTGGESYYKSGALMAKSKNNEYHERDWLEEYYENGALKSRYEYLDKEKFGPYTTYYPNGQIHEKGSYDTVFSNYSQDYYSVQNGASISFYYDGTKKSEGTWHGGKKQNDWKFYNPFGQEEAEIKTEIKFPTRFFVDSNPTVIENDHDHIALVKGYIPGYSSGYFWGWGGVEYCELWDTKSNRQLEPAIAMQVDPAGFYGENLIYGQSLEGDVCGQFWIGQQSNAEYTDSTVGTGFFPLRKPERINDKWAISYEMNQLCVYDHSNGKVEYSFDLYDNPYEHDIDFVLSQSKQEVYLTFDSAFYQLSIPELKLKKQRTLSSLDKEEGIFEQRRELFKDAFVEFDWFYMNDSIANLRVIDIREPSKQLSIKLSETIGSYDYWRSYSDHGFVFRIKGEEDHFQVLNFDLKGKKYNWNEMTLEELKKDEFDPFANAPKRKLNFVDGIFENKNLSLFSIDSVKVSLDLSNGSISCSKVTAFNGEIDTMRVDIFENQALYYLHAEQLSEEYHPDKEGYINFLGIPNSVKDKDIFVTGSNIKRIIFQNQNKDSLIERFVFFDMNEYGDYLFMTPDQYYMGSKDLKELVFFQRGENYFEFEQFDLKYNRPDIILDRLGYADSALVSAYHQAYQKRLKKMGFTEEMLEDDFHLPEIEIENFEEMPSLHDQGSINLKLNLKDSKYKLDRINVWVNDVAIYGTNGISLRDKNVQEYTTNLEVFLAKGNNKVQVSVLNQAGAESYKETFELECTAGKDKPDLYLITIGESEFQQSDFNLTYAAKDAKDMAALFGKSKVYGSVYTKTLVNEQVTAANVKALKSFLQKADINDEVMVFIAGHGVLDANLDYYFATYDMDFQQPQEKGLAYEDVEGLLDGIKPLKKTLLIDACHSGEIDKEEVELAEADVKEEGDIQFRVVGNTASPKLGTQNTSELTKSLFTDLRKGTGATVISSAGGMEFAMEGDDWNNGLFTYCFINGIKTKAADYNNDGEIWLSEIQQYVAQQVYELSGGRQQPTSRIENQTIDFRVW